MKNKKIILAVETSCDETSAAVTCGRRIISNIIWSQVKVHKPWGGVVPNLAKREHQKNINQVVNTALKRANSVNKRLNLQLPTINKQTIDTFAVTIGPGLAPSLEVGVAKAKQLAVKYNRPLVAVNHMEGHLLSSFAQNAKGRQGIKKIEFPVLGLLVSGGHTQLVLMNNFGEYQLLGETLDDAAGEAFDKVAKMLNLGYPGGPIIERLAKKGNENRFDLPVPMKKHKSLNFSFSGLKTACMYKLDEFTKNDKDKQFYQDFAASFQKAVANALTLKLKQAINQTSPNQILLGGGVINNLYIRSKIRKTAKQNNLRTALPFNKKLISDNAGMVGVTAYLKTKRNEFVEDIKQLDRKPSLNF